MQANYKQSKKMHKSWFRLPEYEREAIKEDLAEKFNERLDEEEKEMQVTWIKMLCILLHELFGFGEIRLLRVIAYWKRLYARNKRYKTAAERDAWLDAEMKKLFPKCGFPDVRIQEMKDM